MTNFLLELRSEEIPARMQAKARADLEALFTAQLATAGLQAESITVYSTPRRLALIAHGLPLETQATNEETKGPKTSAPPQALEGFLRKTGLTQDQLTERGGIYFAITEKPGRQAADVLAEAIPAIIRSFPWPKSMRWGDASISTSSLRWVRPLSGIVALLDDEVVPFEVDGIVSGRTTMGHRFMGHVKDTVSTEPVEGRSIQQQSASTSSAQAVIIGSASDYMQKLRDAYVILDQVERQDIIRSGAAKAAADAGLTLVPDEGLVTENAGLTEWPVPLLGRFDAAFLDVPSEVIQLTARVNQKYFVCHDAAGTLANAFVCTANIAAHDGGTAIIAGNEKVLAARLSDAKFFWEADLKVPLETQAAKLSQIVFHEKLGTVADKVERVAKLARWLVEEGVVKTCAPAQAGVQSASTDLPENMDPGLRRGTQGPIDVSALAAAAERAARLCKADLVTGMVGEFPELQGIMGGYYARAQGEDDAVADAVRDHYKPVGQGDDVPTAPVTVAVSLADKLDTLAGFFFEGMPPTGSKDPFALRRSGIGIIQLILNNSLKMGLEKLLVAAIKEFIVLRYVQVGNATMVKARLLDGLIVDESLHVSLDNVFMSSFKSQLKGVDIGEDVVARGGQVKDFLIDRLKVQQKEAGVRHDLIDSVFALGGEDDLVRLLARVKALQAFVVTDEGTNLLAGYKRAANILKSSPERASAPENSSPARGGGSEADGGGFLPNQNIDNAEAPLHHPSGGPPPRSGEELALQSALTAAEPLAAAAILREDFAAAMMALATLRAPIDAFFDGVMVNDPDPVKRAFRIGLLTRFRDAVHTVADFSKIEG